MDTCDLCDRYGATAIRSNWGARKLLLCVPCIERFTSR